MARGHAVDEACSTSARAVQLAVLPMTERRATTCRAPDYRAPKRVHIEARSAAVKVPGASNDLLVGTTTGSSFTTALFVRDLLGLPVAPDVPRLVPRVPVRSLTHDASTTSKAWNAWWSAIEVAEAGRFVAPADPSLAGLLELVRAEAQDWGEAEAEEAVRLYKPRWLPPLLGSTTGSGRHDTEVLPVRGCWSMPLSDRRILVSTAMYGDHEAMDELWQARIGALLTRA